MTLEGFAAISINYKFKFLTSWRITLKLWPPHRMTSTLWPIMVSKLRLPPHITSRSPHDFKIMTSHRMNSKCWLLKALLQKQELPHNLWPVNDLLKYVLKILTLDAYCKTMNRLTNAFKIMSFAQWLQNYNLSSHNFKIMTQLTHFDFKLVWLLNLRPIYAWLKKFCLPRHLTSKIWPSQRLIFKFSSFVAWLQEASEFWMII